LIAEYSTYRLYIAWEVDRDPNTGLVANVFDGVYSRLQESLPKQAVDVFRPRSNGTEDSEASGLAYQSVS
jgi:hypothetical protein